MYMKPAVSTLHLLDRPLEEAFAPLLELGIPRWEVADSGYHALNPKRVERLQSIKADYGVEFSVHAPYSDTNLSADDDLIREWILKRLRASIRFASELGGRYLVVHPGWSPPTERFHRGRAWRTNLRSLHWLLRYAGEYGVECLMENVPNPTPYLLVTLDDFLLFHEEMNPPMGYVLDVAHAHLLGEELDFIEALGPHIRHVHVSDNHGQSDDHLPLGEGDINWPRVLDALDDQGYQGWLVVESYTGVGESIEFLESLL